MVKRKTSLRVLYTINSSPQYILARSQTRVRVELIPYTDDSDMATSPDALNSPPLYASVLLKTCLDTICRSSPELTQDSNRDFSLYVLDPLESNSAPAPVNISNTSTEASSSNNPSAGGQPRGVAVGLGFMSWALSGEDSDYTTVVGTLVKQANGQEALEVIFALRETMAMKRPAWTIQPTSSLPSNSQETSTSSFTASQGDLKRSTSQHPTQSSNSMQSRSSSADLTRETLASIQMRAKAKVKPPKPVRQSTIPVTESDKFLNTGTYIGPLKKKGRPKASGTDAKPNISTNAVASGSGSSSQPKDVIVIDGSDSEGTLPTPMTSDFFKPTKSATSTKPVSKRRTNQPMPPPYTTEPLVTKHSIATTVAPPVQVKVEPQEGPTVLDILALLSANGSEANSQNTAILNALSTIDSSTESGKTPENNGPNPHLVSALKQLLFVYAQSAPPPMNPQTTAPEITKHPHHLSSHSQEVVIVDKENVNPVVHQKRHEDVKGTKFVDSTTHSVSSSPGTSQRSAPSHQERHLHNLGRSSRSNDNISERISPKASASSIVSEKIARKRTLSDFMDEREKGKNKGKGKEREKGEKRDGDRKSSSQRSQKAPIVGSLRHYPQILASNEPRAEQPTNYYRVPLESMTSPARPRPEFDEFPQEEEQKDFDMVETSENLRQCRTPSPRPPLTRVSASSPVRGPHNETRKKYVIPEWARTNTSTKPRLSEEAQRALEQAEERKRQERLAARKKLPSAQAKLKNKEALCSSKTSNANNNRVKPLAPPPPKAQPSRGPITVNDKPMFASSDINFPFISSSRPSSPTPQSTSSQVNQIPKTPKTPTRERRVLEATPGQENESLFTPMGSGSLFGSAHSYTTCPPLAPSILTSPLGNRKKAKLSPMRSMLTGKGCELAKLANSSSSAPNSSDSKDAEDESCQMALDRELEDALEDLDCPPSSLPIASSDIDGDSSSYTASGVETETLDEDLPVKQHWAGLPPSSPPAPSSPMLLPEADQSDEEMDELPIATSDSETDTDMQACGIDTPSPAVFIPQNDDGYPIENNDLSLFTLPEDAESNMDSMGSSDLFDQFTNLNDQSDAFAGMGDIVLDPGMENAFQTGLETMDFTEFWATFMPMVDDNTHNLQERRTTTLLDETQESLLSFGGVDHDKLADDMQTLLSGCLM